MSSGIRGGLEETSMCVQFSTYIFPFKDTDTAWFTKSDFAFTKLETSKHLIALFLDALPNGNW